MDWLLEDSEGTLNVGKSRNGDDGTSLDLNLKRKTVYQIQKLLRETAVEAPDFPHTLMATLLYEEVRKSVAAATNLTLAKENIDCENEREREAAAHTRAIEG